MRTTVCLLMSAVPLLALSVAAQAPPATAAARLEPRQAPVNAFVIESAERPMED